MKDRRPLGVLAALCILGVVGALAIVAILLPPKQPPLLYISGFSDSHIAIAALDPQAPTCSQPRFLLDADFGDLSYVRWTPRRDRIAYVQHPSESDMASLWIMQPDGSGRKQLTPPLPAEFDRRFMLLSLDQRYVALRRLYVPKDVYQPTQSETYILDTQTGDFRQIMTETVGFAWSPTQDLLAIYRWGDRKLYVIQPDGRILSEYRTALAESEPIWSPDGQQIAFTSSLLPDGRVSGIYEIYSLNLKNGQIRQLTKTSGQYYDRMMGSLSWSPNGKHIAFLSDYARFDGTMEAHALFVLDLESGREVRVAGHVLWSAPVWSPDSKKIAFVSTSDGTNYGQMYLVDLTSGETTQLTCTDGIKTSLSW